MSLSTPGVFNVLDDWYMGTGMVAGLTSAAVNNALVLQAIIYAAQNADASGCWPPFMSPNVRLDRWSRSKHRFMPGSLRQRRGHS